MTPRQTQKADPIFEALDTVSEMVSFHADAIAKLGHLSVQLNALIGDRERFLRGRIDQLERKRAAEDAAKCYEDQGSGS